MRFFAKPKNPVNASAFVKNIEERPKLRIVRLNGTITVSNENELEELVKSRRKDQGFRFKNILLDLAEVTYADSAGVAAMVKAFINYNRAHHRLGIVNLNSEIRSMIEILKADTVIAIYASEEEAIKDLEQDW